MIVKIHLAFYDTLFEIYGAFAKYYHRKAKEVPAKSARYERKYRKCIETRDDILEIILVLRELDK